MSNPTVIRHALSTQDGQQFEGCTKATVAGAFNIEYWLKGGDRSYVSVDGGKERLEGASPLWAFGDDGGVPNFPAMSEGVHTVKVTPADAKGKRGTPVVFEVTVKARPPIAGGGAPKPDLRGRVAELEKQLATEKAREVGMTVNLEGVVTSVDGKTRFPNQFKVVAG
ncbi:MAG TPA: hypothetical protein VGN72_06515 [Tepidisphaeraceae bacterium]|nr:hypothetical protein [Tepidisphaeraceae bacterium]